MNDQFKNLAVYGTLKNGYSLDHYLMNTKFISDDKVEGRLYQSKFGTIPYLIEKKDGKYVDVELYSVDDVTFNIIKSMEEGAGYVTKEVKLKSGVMAYVFFYRGNFNYLKEIDKF